MNKKSNIEIKDIVQEFKNFKVNGLNDSLSEDQKNKISDIETKLLDIQAKIKNLEAHKHSLLFWKPEKSRVTSKGDSFTRHLYSVDLDFDNRKKLIIFTHGKSNYTLWFENLYHQLCKVESGEIWNNDVYLSLVFDVNNRKLKTKMSLDRFLYLVEKNEFKIKYKKFKDTYLRPAFESKYVKNKIYKLDSELNKCKKELSDLRNSKFYKEMNLLYKNKNNELTKLYKEITSQEKRDVNPDPAKQLKKKTKLDNIQLELKTLWNSTVSESDKAYFMGWLCKHINRITIKVVDKGVSDKVLSIAYPEETYGQKYREKANSSGWDASSGKIAFKSIENAPIETIKSLSTIKHMRHCKDKGETIFNGKDISNLDLCLFLLSKYNKYGFKCGVKKLNSQINIDDLRDIEFKNNISDFNLGYNA